MSGKSAGGIAASIWVDTIAETLHALNPQVRVLGMPDSPLFFDEENVQTGEHSYTKNLANVAKLANSHHLPPHRECALHNKDELWKCFQGEEILKYVKSPVFLVQSLVDTYTIRFVMGIECVMWIDLDFFGSTKKCSESNLERITQLSERTRRTVQQLQAARPDWGFWSPSCMVHVFTLFQNFYDSPAFAVPGGSPNTLAHSIRQYLAKEQVHYIDSVNYPHNTQCVR